MKALRTGMVGTLREQSRDQSAVATAAAAVAPNFFSKVRVEQIASTGLQMRQLESRSNPFKILWNVGTGIRPKPQQNQVVSMMEMVRAWGAQSGLVDG